MITHSKNKLLRSRSALPEVRVQRGGLEIVDQLADAWRGLCTEAINDEPFFRPEFIRAHIQTVIPNSTILLITAWVDSQLRLVLPLVEELGSFSKMPVRKLRAPVNYNCGRFDAVCHASMEGDAAIAATWQYLKDLGGWDLLQFRDTLEGSTVSRLAELAKKDGFAVLQQADQPNPHLPIPDDLALHERIPHNAKLRSQLRQIRRRIAEQGVLRFYRVSTADAGALERFYHLEASGWKGQEGSDILHDGTRAFFDTLAESAAKYGYFSLYMLEFNDELIAAHYALTYRRRCYSPKVAFNEKYRHLAPGHLIISEILKDCAHRGITSYDITGQDQDWKMKWATETLAVSHHFIFKGSLGRLAHAVGNLRRPSAARVPARLPAGSLSGKN